MPEDEEMETWKTQDTVTESRTGLFRGSEEIYRYLRIFYDPRTKTWADDHGNIIKTEVANPRTIGIITRKEHRNLFGFEAVGQLYLQLGMPHLADAIEQNHESYFVSTVSIGGEGRKDNRKILGGADAAPKKKGLLGFGSKGKE